MGALGLGRRRRRARRGLLALLAAMTALIVLALGGIAVLLDVSSTAGVRTALASLPATSQVSTIQTRLLDDPTAQDEAARQLIAQQLPGAHPWTVLRSAPLPIADAEATIMFVADADIASFADLVSGQWPAADSDVALPQLVADALALQVGDTLAVSSDGVATELTVTGVWTATDPAHNHWAGDTSVVTGTDPSTGAAGPAVVTWDGMQALVSAPYIQWIVDAPAITPEQLPTWLANLPALPDRLEAADLTTRGVVPGGMLHATLGDVSESLVAVRASSSVPVVIVAITSLVALWQITRLLAVLRERETLVMLSRGATWRQFLRMNATEAGLVCLGAVGAGGALAALMFKRSGFEPISLIVVVVGVVVATLATVLGVQGRAVLHGLRPASDSGRTRTVLGGAAVIATTAIAAFSVWRFLRNGGPLVPGSQALDVVAVGGPALALIAAALITVALVGPALRALAAASGQSRRLSPSLELRQTSRRISVNAVPVALVALATAVAVLASAYSGTWQSLRVTSSQVALGSDVRLQTVAGIVKDQPAGVAQAAGFDGAAAATGIITAPAIIDEQTGELTAVSMTDLDRVSTAPAALLAQATTALTPATDPLPGIELGTAASISATVTASATSSVARELTDRRLDVRVWLRDGSELIVVDLGTMRVPSNDGISFDPTTFETFTVDNPAAGVPITGTLEADLPSGSWSVVAIDTTMQATLEPAEWHVNIDSLQADGSNVLGTQVWDPNVLPALGDDATYQPEGNTGFTTFVTAQEFNDGLNLDTTAAQRFMLAGGPVEVPALVTPAWAALVRPDGSDVQVGPTTVRLQQVGVIPVVPGNPNPAAVLVDLPSLQNALLRTTEDLPALTQLWVRSTGDPIALADTIRTADPRRIVEATGEGVTDAVAAPARVVYWLAAIAALLLALPAIAAVAMVQATARRGEVVVLRAVGVGARHQGRGRAVELLLLDVAALVAGLLAGWGLSTAIVEPLVRSTTPQVSHAVPLQVQYSWAGGGVLVGAITLTLVLVALWYGARVARQARDTQWREEIR